MVKILSNYFVTLFLLFSLNSCSTISDTIDLAGIVDKTEDFLFGNEKEQENENLEVEDENINENSIISEQEVEEDSLEIDDIPTDKPEFSDIEKNFFEGEKTDENEIESTNSSIEETVIENKVELLSSEQKNIDVISNIPQNVRMRVRMLLLNSDPPTVNPGKPVLYQEEEKDALSYNENDKIAVFFFPNNSVIPYEKAENVINEIVKFYSQNPLLLVGHASSLGGNKPKGKKINMELSFARAETIKNMLTNKGFPVQNITVLGKGDLEPSLKSNPNNKDSNDRRVEVFLFSN